MNLETNRLWLNGLARKVLDGNEQLSSLSLTGITSLKKSSLMAHVALCAWVLCGKGELPFLR